MTKGDLVFECARSLGLSDDVSTDELILLQKWANRGVVDVLTKTKCYVDIGTMTLQANITDYRLDSSILVVDNITVPDSTNSPTELDIVPMTEILPYLAPNVAPTVTPLMASIDGSLMRVAPAPSTSVALTYIYVPRPASMGEDGTKGNDSLDPSNATYGGIPIEYHDAILMYMLWQAAQYDQQGGGFFRGHAFAPGSAYQATYDERCKEIRRLHRRKSGRGLHRGRVGYPSTRKGFARNDVYPRITR